MITYTFTTTDKNPVISVDPIARVKQFTIWGSFGTATVKATVDDAAPFESVIDASTGLILTVDSTKNTFSIIDTYILKVQFTVAPTGAWYVGVQTRG